MISVTEFSKFIQTQFWPLNKVKTRYSERPLNKILKLCFPLVNKIATQLLPRLHLNRHKLFVLFYEDHTERPLLITRCPVPPTSHLFYPTLHPASSHQVSLQRCDGRKISSCNYFTRISRKISLCS